MAQQMAFGNRMYATWIPAPLKGLVAPLRGMVGARQLANGQQTITRSRNFRKRFEFSYKGTGAALDPIQDFVEGQYGDGPWLFNHPDALNGNMVPRTWSQFARAIGSRGNQALDFWSGAFAFGAPLSATLPNPTEQPLILTGLAGAPSTGATIWTPNNTPPVWPATYLTRPFISLLLPPNHGARVSVWGLANSINSPALYCAPSFIPAATVGAGSRMVPTQSGASLSWAASPNWRVLDLWIAAGTPAPTPQDYTTFSALDVRMAPGAAPAMPTVFDFGRGQFPCQFTEDNIGVTLVKVGRTDAGTYYQLDGSMEEVSSPW